MDEPEAMDEPVEFCLDVFVSYSHGAFRGRSNAPLKDWSRTFCEDLRGELATAGSDLDEIRLYLDDSDRADESVDPTLDLDEQLKAKVEGAAVLTVLMTPQYLQSRWCARELEWWLAANSPDPVGVDGRLAVCRVLPTDDAQWPDGPSGLPGLWFHDQDREPEKVRPHRWQGTSTGTDAYWDAMQDLSGTVLKRLRQVQAVLAERASDAQQRARLAMASGQVVYLHARAEAEATWHSTCASLQGEGFTVLPASGPEPVAPHGRLDTESQVQLAHSDALLLLAAEDDRAIDTDMVAIGRHGRNLALGADRAFLPCAVLDAGGVASPQRTTNARHLGIEWLDATAPGWWTGVREWLAGLESAPGSMSAAP